MIAAACLIGAAVVLGMTGSVMVLRAALAGVTLGVVVIMAIVVMTANAAGRRLAGGLSSFRLQVTRGQDELRRITDQAMRGERPALPAMAPPPGRAASADPFRLLAYDFDQVQQAAGQAILEVSERRSGGSDQRVEIFVNLARRMQSLVHREIEMLDTLEAQVEDPDLLKGLFTVDHLATRMRRQSESLAVLGGSTSRRQWTRQVTMHEVLRASVAEVEQYSRVKIVPPVEGLVRGPAVSDIIHLIAELVENATKFSAPRTQVLLRAQQVTAGVAIEVEDRGLGMVAGDQQRMNKLLAEPGGIDLEELLRDGRIGLYVVAALAGHHDIRVQLQGNIYGGTSAVVVLPWALLNESGGRELPRSAGGRAAAGPTASDASPGETRRREADPGPGRDRELVTAAAGERGAATAVPNVAARPNRATGPALTRPQQVLGHAAAQSAVPAEPPSGERPPLPRRRPQTSLAAQFHDRPGTRPAPARPSDPLQEHTPGLMADFLRGVGLSEDEDVRPDADGTTRLSRLNHS